MPAAALVAALAVLIAACSDDPQALHRNDLAAIRATLESNHPGASAGADAAFAAWAGAGLAAAEARGPEVADRAGHFYSLSAYTAGFRDTHVAVTPTLALPPTRWPGFLVALKGAKAVVVDRDAKRKEAPALGAIIGRCDGARVAELVRTRVLPTGFDQRVPANRARAVAEAFLDRANPFAPPLKACAITSGGVTKTVALTYAPVPDGFAARLDAALFGPPASVGWSEPAPGIVWIGLPSFDYDETNAARLRKLMDRVAASAEHVRQGRAIVFDVRGNAGGSSLWGDEIRDILWYPEAVAKYAPGDPSAVDWRASPGNRDFMLNLISEVIPKVGSQSPVGRNLTRIAGGLSAAVEEKKPFWREGNEKPPKGGGLTQRRPKAAPPLFPAKVIILSNGSCASACLDFADRILQMPGTYGRRARFGRFFLANVLVMF